MKSRSICAKALLLALTWQYAASEVFLPSSLTTAVSSPATAQAVYSQQQNNKGHHQRRDSIQQFLQDLDKLNALDGHIPILAPTHAKHDSSFTRNWNNDDWERHQVRSLRRYLQHLISWPVSPTAQAVLPTVSVLLLWTLAVYFLSTNFEPIADVLSKATFPTASFAGPISLLLAMRTNRALNRLLEARSAIGKMIRVTAGLTGLGAAYFPNEDVSLLFGRYLCLYGWTVKGHYRVGEDISQILSTMLPPEEAQWMQQSPADAPSSMVFRLRLLLSANIKDLPLAAAQAMEERLCELESAMGVCKRILASPIPPTYTRHTSRVLCLFLGMLPLSMVGSKSSLLSTMLSISLISYVFVGIDEIGVEIEHPFPMLPLYALAKVIQMNVRNHCLIMAQGAPTSKATP